MKTILVLAVILTLVFSCNNSSQVEKVDRAFYYWKEQDLQELDVENLKLANAEKLYVKLFEVDYSEALGNFPYCKNRQRDYIFEKLDSIKVVPTVFIKNDIFQFNNEESLDKLADNIVFLVNKYSFEDGYRRENVRLFQYDEIQIDCDWTNSTRDKYFYLLGKIKELSSKQISCTLRLYPYKYPEIMGVPPVDKAMLMCYNLIKPLSEKEKNSILDIEELKLYLNEEYSYPLHLDIALPTFCWTHHYQNNQFQKLIDLSSKDVEKFATPVQPLWYQVERDTVLQGNTYLKAGDQLKCEDVSAETLFEAIRIIRKNVNLEKNTTISLFDLDQSTFNQYSSEELSDFYNRFTE